MTLSEAIERLKAEKSYAEYALMHNPNDERYKSLVDAIDTIRKWIDDLICCVSKFSCFKEKEDTPNADELPFG